MPLPVLDNVTVGLDRREISPAVVRSLYVHVPFCFHKCHYCDFYSITRQSPERMNAFVDRVLSELDGWASASVELPIETIFFGGGTPSLLPLEAMHRLLEGIAARMNLSGLVEWTIEVNPATADGDYLAMIKSLGVDRISLGAQSFDEQELRVLERHHEPDDVLRGLELARAAGIARQSIDLIYAVPGQTLQSWQQSLERAIALGTEHLSCYGLTYEPNTPLAVRRRLGRVESASESLEVSMFKHTRQRLAEAGRAAYEVSNYAQPGRESRHNLSYWAGDNYLGLGPSAASHLDGLRFRNAPRLGQWESTVDAGHLAAIDVERLEADERARELAWLNLRTTRGIDTSDFERRTGVSPTVRFSEVIDTLGSAGLLEVEAGRVRLTDKAWPVADGVAAEFLSAE